MPRLKQPLTNSTAKSSMAVPSQSTKPVLAKTALQAVVVAVDASMALAATSVAVAAVVVMTAVAAVVAADAATSAVVNISL